MPERQKTVRQRLTKAATSLALLAVCLAGMLLLRDVAIKRILSNSSNTGFFQIQLFRGMKMDLALEKLGPPDAHLHLPSQPGEPAREVVGYTRDQHALELTFVGGELTNWVVSRPIDIKELDNAKTQVIPCCPEDRGGASNATTEGIK